MRISRIYDMLGITVSNNTETMKQLYEGHYDFHFGGATEDDGLSEPIDEFIDDFRVVDGKDPPKKINDGRFVLCNGGEITVTSVIDEGVRVSCFFSSSFKKRRSSSSKKHISFSYCTSIDILGSNATREEMLKQLPDALNKLKVPADDEVRKTLEEIL